MRKKKEKIAEVAEIVKAAVEVKERKQASAQELIRRMLVNDFLFQSISKRATSFGERILLHSPEARVEAHLGVYRVCFYLNETTEQEPAANNLPTKRVPRCFDTDQRSLIKEFLIRVVGKPVSKKGRAGSKQIELFPAQKEAA
ncbi:MAG: hypothetical protein M3209_00715 [Acidobacteriota bacterium]|nr:hypothetical protein [Acidobacteriota bacterium]